MTDLRAMSLTELVLARSCAMEWAPFDEELRRRDEAMKNLYVALKEIVEHPAAFSDGASRLWTQARSALAALEAP